jgi:hypothetical protein
VTTATFLAPNLLPGWLIGFWLMAAGMLAMAWALRLIPEGVWHPRSRSDPVSVTDQRAPLPPDNADLDDAERVTDPEQAGRTQWTERIDREVAPAKGTRR